MHPLRSRYATEFPTEEALQDYLEAHPNADPANHTVAPEPEPEDPKADDEISDEISDSMLSEEHSAALEAALSPHMADFANASPAGNPVSALLQRAQAGTASRSDVEQGLAYITERQHLFSGPARTKLDALEHSMRTFLEEEFPKEEAAGISNPNVEVPEEDEGEEKPAKPKKEEKPKEKKKAPAEEEEEVKEEPEEPEPPPKSEEVKQEAPAGTPPEDELRSKLQLSEDDRLAVQDELEQWETIPPAKLTGKQVSHLRAVLREAAKGDPALQKLIQKMTPQELHGFAQAVFSDEEGAMAGKKARINGYLRRVAAEDPKYARAVRAHFQDAERVADVSALLAQAADQLAEAHALLMGPTQMEALGALYPEVGAKARAVQQMLVAASATSADLSRIAGKLRS